MSDEILIINDKWRLVVENDEVRVQNSFEHQALNIEYRQ